MNRWWNQIAHKPTKKKEKSSPSELGNFHEQPQIISLVVGCWRWPEFKSISVTTFWHHKFPFHRAVALCWHLKDCAVAVFYEMQICALTLSPSSSRSLSQCVERALIREQMPACDIWPCRGRKYIKSRRRWRKEKIPRAFHFKERRS